jgi:hypothetical protein
MSTSNFYSNVSDEELLDTIERLARQLVSPEDATDRHDRAGAANSIVLCAAVLQQRLKAARERAAQCPQEVAPAKVS